MSDNDVLRNTTDPQDEQFDVCNADGSPAGYAKPRGLIHRDGDWHRSLHLWIYGVKEDGEPFVLFQRRSATKDTWPGALDVAVGGHIRAGETLEQTVREADEEIGLDVAYEDLVPIGRRFHAYRGSGFFDCEINEVFVARCDWKLTKYRLHPDEVAGIVQIKLDHAIKLFNNEKSSVPAIEYHRLGATLTGISLAINDFVDTQDNYATAVLGAIQSLLSGQHPELFVIGRQS